MATNDSRRPVILISEPQAIDYPFPFLPYMWAVLKSYWERHGTGADAYQWLDPVYVNALPDDLLRPYGDTKIDVLGLSCYTWNWNLQCAIAERVKARNPECLVVAGGPDPDFKDPEFFRKHPYIDMVAVKDGEITFAKILTKLLAGERNFLDIKGLYLPAPAHGTGRLLPTKGGINHVFTGPAEVPSVFDYSPYLDQRAYYENLVKDTRPGSFHVSWETNRGCPYACSYCDWGSATMSKVRRYDMRRLEAEIEWFSQLKIGMIFCADANFGILARDIELADKINNAFLTRGFPAQFNYSAAKNNPDRVMTIAQKFAETGVCANHMLAIQHTSPEVLAATDRANISTDKQVKVARALMSSGVPITVQLILGIPGDSLELWKRCLTDVMELGVHEDYEIYFYSLLPNAPAAEPEFMSQWQVETIDRYIFVGTAPSWKPSELGVRSNQSRLIVSTRSFSRQDWLQMWIYTVLVKALHNASVTRMIAMYLRLTHQVTYLAFYEGLVEEFFAKSPVTRAWYDEVVDCYRNFREQGDVRDRISVSDLPGFSQALEPSRWVDLQICRNFDRFFDALKAYLLAKYPEAPNLASVIEYQKQIVILPSYDRKRGKNFSTEHNWMRYFSEAAGRMGSESMGEPEFVPGSVVEVSDQTCGEKGHLVRPLDWGEGGESQRWIAWINSALQHRNSAPKRNFQRLQFRAPARAYAEAR